MSSPGGSRLAEIDALRGVAACSVVAFHFTTQFIALFDPGQRPSLAAPLGHYGVNLFFIISGFVIFMTLERTRQPMDFVVSRFSRLFPAYWLAVLLTFAVTHVLGLPGKEVGAPTALANLTMVHGLFGVAHVDNVYWTLEVELLFYAGMLGLYLLRGLGRIHLVLWALLALRLVYWAGQTFGGVTLLPWRVVHLLILQYLPWFALGISIYLLTHRDEPAARRRAWITGAAALATLALVESWAIGLLASALAALAYAAASGRARWLQQPVLVWLGAISYPLYLLHENIGWSVMRRLLATGLPLDACILITLAMVLLLAHAVHRWVELPSMQSIRQRYRQRQGAG